MLSSLLSVLLGVVVVLVITAFTGYFVAQEFGYMAVDRSALRARAGAGDLDSQRALDVTRRTSFMLSGAQLGITITGLIVGYVAEPLIGRGLGSLLGVAGVPTAVGVAVGTVLALLFATVVQMVFGELFPKNLAIARPEPVARRLAFSTNLYLKLFGWLIRVFDAASNRLLRTVRIEPVHDVEHAATAHDLEAIIDQSRQTGDLPPDLSTLLDRVLDFNDRTAAEAMIPRPRVQRVAADEPLVDVLRRMARGHSRYPVVGQSVDDVLGVVYLRDLLALSPDQVAGRAGDVARPALLVPESAVLLDVLEQLREADAELACVIDEYGGFAGVVTEEDIAEELVGEITDEHDPGDVSDEPFSSDNAWTVPGSMHLDEVQRLLDHDLPHGPYTTIGGLVITELGRLPQLDDTITITLPAPDPDAAGRVLTVTVAAVDRRVPSRLQLRWAHGEGDGGADDGEAAALMRNPAGTSAGDGEEQRP